VLKVKVKAKEKRREWGNENPFMTPATPVLLYQVLHVRIKDALLTS
jgi:hypothetical protein